MTSITQAAISQAGRPNELVSDNETEVCSVWEQSLTAFGKLLVEHQVTHRTIAPYYPQGNGKAKAFIKTLNRELLERRSFDTGVFLLNCLEVCRLRTLHILP